MAHLRGKVSLKSRTEYGCSIPLHPTESLGKVSSNPKKQDGYLYNYYNDDTSLYLSKNNQPKKSLTFSNKTAKINAESQNSQFKAFYKPFNHKVSIGEKLTLEKEKAIDVSSVDFINKIKEYCVKNPNTTVELINFKTVIDKKEFIDLITENRIPFTSKELKDKPLAEAISRSFLYMSNKKSLKHGNPLINKHSQEAVKRFTKKIGPILDVLHLNGHKTYASKVKELNSRMVETYRGKNNKWHINSVRLTWNRWKEIKVQEEENKTSMLSKTTKASKNELQNDISKYSSL